jgi:hypothetical protein
MSENRFGKTGIVLVNSLILPIKNVISVRNIEAYLKTIDIGLNLAIERR